MASYSEKLKDPRWQKKRLEILNRDNFTCKLCDDNKTELHVHHKEYYKNPWDAESVVLQTLCKNCHYFIESLKKDKYWEHEYITKILKNGRGTFIAVVGDIEIDPDFMNFYIDDNGDINRHGTFNITDVKLINKYING